MRKKPNDQYSEEEAARQRDEVIRRMANIPPQLKAKISVRPNKKMKAVAGHAVHNVGARCEA